MMFKKDKNIRNINLERPVYSILAVFVLFGVGIAYAGGGAILVIEAYVELTNLFLITIILFISFDISFRMGGVVREVVNAIILVLIFFWLKEFIAVLNGFKVIAIEGAADTIEFFMILTLLVVMNKLRKLL